MNTEEFGYIAKQLCETDGVESEAVGNILWAIWYEYINLDTDEWQEDDKK